MALGCFTARPDEHRACAPYYSSLVAGPCLAWCVLDVSRFFLFSRYTFCHLLYSPVLSNPLQAFSIPKPWISPALTKWLYPSILLQIVGKLLLSLYFNLTHNSVIGSASQNLGRADISHVRWTLSVYYANGQAASRFNVCGAIIIPTASRT